MSVFRQLMMNRIKFKQVDYIKSTRTQYIVTDYKPQNNTYVETYVRFSDTFKDTETYGGNGNLFGSGGNNKAYGCNFGGSATEYNRIYFWVTPYNGSSSVRYIINNDYNQIQKLEITSSLFVWGSNSNYKQTPNSDSNINLCLFGHNEDGTAVPFTCYDMEIHYYFKIWEGEDLVRNYIPVYNTITQKYGLYDTVTKTFVGNSGTGDFLGGND